MSINQFHKIEALINQYFQGIYQGDVEMLRNCFANNAHLYGDIKGSEYNKSLDDYIDGVRNRESPESLNEPFKMEIIGIEAMGNVAIARLHLPILGFNYYDFLSLAVVNSEWKIVNKIFTHVE